MENIDRNNSHPLVSIIIPCKEINQYTRRCIDSCNKLYYTNREIMVVTDKECPGFPSKKRNYALNIAKGEVIAFIDSDAYCPPYWLETALAFLKEHRGVCGPGILPPNASLLEQATDLVLKFLPYSYRVTPKRARKVAEYPTFNLIVWKTDIRFKNYLTGEDSLYCRQLSDIYYSPLVWVYHNRRPLFKPYWKQIRTYGWHRGHLIRLALLGWLSTWFVYPINFIKGFFEPGTREDEDGEL